MSDVKRSADPLLVHLIVSLQSAALYQMGRTVSPISGKIEKDMAQAGVSINILLMIQKKMAGNLNDEEQKILDTAVTNLQTAFEADS